MTQRDALVLLVHGEPGAGKSWLGQTAPSPRLVLDAEGGSRTPRRLGPDGKSVRIKQIVWNPRTEPMPEPGDWESCRVVVHHYDDIVEVYKVLNAGNHPFKSVVLDSVTEIQKRCKDAIRTGDEAMDQRLWGVLLDRMELQIRQYRDLATHPVRPLEAIVILALTVERSLKFKPAVQGALGVSLPGFVDVIGFLTQAVDEDGKDYTRLLIRPHERYEAKDRTHVLREHYGPVINNASIEEMVAVYNEENI